MKNQKRPNTETNEEKNRLPQPIEVTTDKSNGQRKKKENDPAHDENI